MAAERRAAQGVPHVDLADSGARDGAGRLVRDARFRYGYDPVGQLAEVRSVEDGRLVASHRYNEARERVWTASATTAGHSQVRRFLWSNGLLAAELDERGNVRRQYVYLADGHRTIPVAMLDSVGDGPGGGDGGRAATLAFVHVDHRGAPIATTDAQGRVRWRAALSPNGAAYPLPGAGPASSEPPALRLPGQRADPATGLHDNGYRTYDPQAGRYLQPDPLGYPDGPDPHAYGSGDPVNRIDPHGLYEVDVHYYLTTFLGIAAGLSPVAALRVGSAAQYVDENPVTRPVDGTSTWSTLMSPFGNQAPLLRYHFVLSGSDGRTLAAYRNSRLDQPDSPQLALLWNAANAAQLSDAARQVLLGEYLHALADTFAHRDHLNRPIDALFAGCGIGHGAYGHEPDYTYDDVQGRIRWSREGRTLQMAAAVHARLSGMPGAGRALDWSRIEPYLREFAAVRENADTAFPRKLAVLNRALAELGFVGAEIRRRTDSDATAAGGARTEMEREVDQSGGGRAAFPGVCFPNGQRCESR